MTDSNMIIETHAFCADADVDAARRCHVFKPTYGARPESFLMNKPGFGGDSQMKPNFQMSPSQTKPLMSYQQIPTAQHQQKQNEVYQPRHQPAHEAFRFKPTSLHFDMKAVSVQELTDAVLEWAENEQTVEIQKDCREKGTVSLIAFVNRVILVEIKLRFWTSQQRNLVIEVDLRNGCSLAFGVLFQDMRDSILPEHRVDVSSEDSYNFEQSSETTKDASDSDNYFFDEDDETMEEIDLSLDFMEELQDASQLPDFDAWCEVLERDFHSDSSESWVQMALQYQPKQLVPLAECLSVANGLLTESSDASAFGIATLISYMVEEEQSNCELLKQLCPQIMEKLQELCASEKPWFSVISALMAAYVAILRGCQKFQLALPEVPSTWPPLPQSTNPLHANKISAARRDMNTAQYTLKN